MLNSIGIFIIERFAAKITEIFHALFVSMVVFGEFFLAIDVSRIKVAVI